MKNTCNLIIVTQGVGGIGPIAEQNLVFWCQIFISTQS